MTSVAVAAAVVSKNVQSTRPYTVHEESPSQSPTTPVRQRKYPHDLSRVPATLRAPMAHRRGNSKQYESLEDLLTAAGYKETRIFTPETERISEGSTTLRSDKRSWSGQSARDTIAASEEATSGPRSSSGGIGGLVSSFLSGWMPGASVSLGRAKGAEIARRDANEAFKADEIEDSPPPSPLARKSALPDGRSPLHQFRHSRPGLPSDFISNSSQTQNSTSSTPQLQLIPGRTLSALPRVVHHRLHHTASSPHLSRSKMRDQDASGRPGLRGRQSQATLTKRAVDTLQRAYTAPNKPAPLQHSHRLHPNLKSRQTLMSPILHASSGPLVPILRTEDVVCRSVPGSRSASREGGRSRRSSDDPPPFFLSPTFGDENSPMWRQTNLLRYQPTIVNSSGTSDSDDDQNPDDTDPNLERIIFSRALRHRDVSPPSSSTTTTTSSSRMRSSLDAPSIARRQRSIQSLRAHLVPRPASTTSTRQPRTSFPKNPIITVATPRTSEARLPGRAVWLDGPEWDGVAPKNKKSRRSDTKDSQRGLIPWFGGERAFIERDSPPRTTADSEWDGWE